MCLWLAVSLLVLVVSLGYGLWVANKENNYWLERCDELEAKLYRVSDMERLESIAMKTQKYESGISVKFDP